MGCGARVELSWVDLDWVSWSGLWGLRLFYLGVHLHIKSQYFNILIEALRSKFLSKVDNCYLYVPFQLIVTA